MANPPTGLVRQQTLIRRRRRLTRQTVAPEVRQKGGFNEAFNRKLYNPAMGRFR